MKKRGIHLLMLLCVIMLGCLYSNTLMAEGTEYTYTYTLENAPRQKYFLEGIDTALDYSGAEVTWVDENDVTQREYYNPDNPETGFTFEYAPGSIQVDDDGNLLRTDSTVPVTVKYNKVEVGTYDVRVVSKEECRVSIYDGNLRKVQLLTDKTIDCTSENSYLTAQFYYADEMESFCGIPSWNTEKWEKAGFSISCTWEDGTTGFDIEKAGEANLHVQMDGWDVSQSTVNVIESLDNVTEFNQTGADAGYQINPVKDYGPNAKRGYYKLIIPEEGDYCFYGRSDSDFHINGEIWNETFTTRNEILLDIWNGDNYNYLKDKQGYYRANNSSHLKKGTYYLVVTSCSTSNRKPADFYYQKLGTVDTAEVSGTDAVKKEYLAGTSVNEMDFSALTWTFTFDDKRKETMKGAGYYYSKDHPTNGVAWTSSVKPSAGFGDGVYNAIGSMTIRVDYFKNDRSLANCSFDVAIKPFAEMVSSYKATLNDVKTDYIHGLESELDTSGIRVTYKIKGKLFEDSITPGSGKWNDYGFSIHCIWEAKDEDGQNIVTGLELTNTGKATVKIMLGEDLVKSYDIFVAESLDQVISGTFSQPGTTYDVERTKGTPGYYYKMKISEAGDYDFYVEDFRSKTSWEDRPELILYRSQEETTEEARIPLYVSDEFGEEYGDTLDVDEDGWFTRIQNLEPGDYYVVFEGFPLNMDRQLTFRYEKAKELERYELSLSDDVKRNYAAGDWVYNWNRELKGVGIAVTYTDGTKETIGVGSKKWDIFGFYYNVVGIMKDSGYLQEGSGKISFFRDTDGILERLGSFRVYVKPFEEMVDSYSVSTEEFRTTYTYGFDQEIYLYDLTILYTLKGETGKHSVACYEQSRLDDMGFSVHCIWDTEGEPIDSLIVQELPSANLKIFFGEKEVASIPITVSIPSTEGNVDIKGTFDHADQEYFLMDTAAKGVNYYKWVVEQPGKYDLFINHALDEDEVYVREIRTADYDLLVSEDTSGKDFWFWPDNQGRIGSMEMEAGTYYICFDIYPKEDSNMSFSFSEAKEVKSYKVSFDEVSTVYREGTNFDFQHLQTTLTYEDGTREIIKGAGAYWSNLGFSYEITGVGYIDYWSGLDIGQGTITVYYGSGDSKTECGTMNFEVKSREDMAQQIELDKTLSMNMERNSNYSFTIEEEDYYDFLLKPQQDVEYYFLLYKKPADNSIMDFDYYKENASEEMELATTLYLTPGTYYLETHVYGEIKETDFMIRKSGASKIASFTLDTSGANTTYLAGHSQYFDIDLSAGLKAHVVYENGSEETIASNQSKWKGLFETTSDLKFDTTGSLYPLKAGNYTVSVKGGGQIQTYPIEVKDLKEYPTTKELTETGRQKGTITKPGEVLKYSFTAPKTGTYYFYGVADKDSDAILWKADGYSIATSMDKETFSLSWKLTEGTTYYLTTSFKKSDVLGELEFIMNEEPKGTAHAHVYGEYVVVKEATCTEAGIEQAICKYCEVTTEQEIEPLGHAYKTDYQKMYESTCEEPGKEYRICTRCHERDEQEIPPLGHEFSKEYTVVEATKEKAGETYRPCLHDGCTAKTDVTVIPKLNSVYATAEDVANNDSDNEKTINAVNGLVADENSNAATIKENMNMDSVVSLEEKYVAAEDKVVATDVASETFEKDTIQVEGAALTVSQYITEDSTDKYQASLAVNNVDSNTVAEKNEELAEKIQSQEAYVLDINLSIQKVNEEGLVTDKTEHIQPAAPIKIRIPMPEAWKTQPFELYHYTDAGEVEKIDFTINTETDPNMIEFVVTALSYYSLQQPCQHTYLEILETGLKPTCITAGWRWTQCEECKKIMKQAINPLHPDTGHEIVEDPAVPATCTEPGKTAGEHCSECKETLIKQEVIPATGHTEVIDPAVPATATTPGKTEGKHCSVCGTVIVAQQTIPAIGQKEEQKPAETPSQKPAALTPYIKLSATSLPLQLKKSTTALKVVEMQKGDAVASYTSSNPKVVAVNATTGKLTGKKVGKAVITVTLRSGVKATCTVKVQKNKVTTKSIKIGMKKLTLKRGAKATIPITLNPLTSTDKIKVTSSNKKVATVTNKGVVKAKKKGTAKITIQSGKKKVVCKVTVK